MSTVSPQKRLPVLPIDIIHAIVDELFFDFDIENSDSWIRHQRRKTGEHYSKALLNLRVACREFCLIVSPRIFRTLRLTHTLRSIRSFLAIMQSPWVSQCVQAVRYQYWDPEPHRYETISPDDKSARDSRVEIRQMLRHALSRLHELPALRSISIRFGDISPQVTELDFVMDDLSTILDALVFLGTSLPRPLESLSLTRLPPFPLPQYDLPAFCALRENLSLLEIHCASTDAWSGITTDPLPPGLISPCEPFFSHTLPLRILPPPSAATGLENLGALSLCFSDPVGIFYIRYSFAELYFPRLRALRLQHVQFSMARDAERFITQHGATLLELHLAHCQVAVEQNSDDDGFFDWPVVPRPWSDIYAEFTKKLGHLVFLDVQDPWWLSFPERYVAYSAGEVMQFLEEGRDDDARQLGEFQRTVQDRAEHLGTHHELAFPIRDEEEFICDCR